MGGTADYGEKKAPARAKAKVDYLLTTKLFCGHCNAAMTGISGTSKTERKYHYYQCVPTADKSCDKKTVSKEYIEDLVVNKLREFLTADDNINMITKEVVDLCERESSNGNAKQLQNSFTKNDSGKFAESLGEWTGSRYHRRTDYPKKKEHDELSRQLLLETSKYHVPSVKDIRFFLNQFRKGDINDLKYRRALVDMLVNKIYLYDEMTVLCNTQDGHSRFDLKELVHLRVTWSDCPKSHFCFKPTISCN